MPRRELPTVSTAARVIDAFGGNTPVQKLTGLSKGRISQWRTENHIPRVWLRVLRAERPDVFIQVDRADRRVTRRRERRQAA